MRLFMTTKDINSMCLHEVEPTQTKNRRRENYLSLHNMRFHGRDKTGGQFRPPVQ